MFSPQPPEFRYCSGCAVDFLDEFCKVFIVCYVTIFYRLYMVRQLVLALCMGQVILVAGSTLLGHCLSSSAHTVQLSEPSLPPSLCRASSVTLQVSLGYAHSLYVHVWGT